MTDKQKVEALQMLLNGATYAEVGRKYMLSTETIRKMFINILDRGTKSHSRVECIYQGLGDWCEKNGYTAHSLGKKLGVGNGVMHKAFREKGYLRKDNIDKILELTGMTYEECFAKRKAPEDAATSIKG